MIKINNVNKYFNKNKSNEIHVINNTSLEFPKVGLVCLLGASGSGKTTLLNVVGGLDKINSGEIKFKDYSIKKYKSSKWDYIRNRHFGYIFQNYILLPELTVYQNLELVLKILNLEKEEIDKRIDYALTAVGMIKYKKRKPTQLSGGQQQRIAIARALVKSPDVIIADEPTGNLDEKNSTQIMNIIKKLSKECLVILVTHERRLAEFYGDRIIEIADGKVFNDISVTSSNDFQEVDNNNIYLKEFDNVVASNEDINIKYFYKDNKEKLDLNIIFKDNTFYIHSPFENIKIKFIDKSNEIKVIDTKKPVISKQDIDDFDYHLPKIEYKEGKSESVIKFKDTLKMAFRHIGELKNVQKFFFFFVMFLAAIMISIGFINLFSVQHIEEDDFFYFNRNLVVANSDINYNKIKDIISDDDIVLLSPDFSTVSNLNNGYFNQKKHMINVSDLANFQNTTSVIPLETVKNPTIIEGRLPNNDSEAVIDMYLVNKYLENPSFTSAGIKYRDQIIGMTFSIFDFKQYYEGLDQYTIVGIIDNNNPNIYINLSSYKAKAVSNFLSYAGYSNVEIGKAEDLKDVFYNKVDENGNVLGEQYPISELVLGDNQVVIDNSFYNYLSNKGTKKTVINLGYNNEIEIVGVVTYSRSSMKSFVYMNNDDFISDYYEDHLSYMSDKNNIKDNNEDKYEGKKDGLGTLVIHSQNPKALIEKFENNDINAMTLYNLRYEELKAATINPQAIITPLVILSASLIFLYFIMRSSMMARIYQIGVYRALGIKKSNVYKIFFTEIFTITALTSLFAVFFVGFIVNRINEIIEVIYFPWYITPLSLLTIFVVNVLVGLLPVINLLRLTPSQILSKYDI